MNLFLDAIEFFYNIAMQHRDQEKSIHSCKITEKRKQT